MYGYPYFHSDDVVLNDAYRIAVGDLAGNVVPYRGGLLEKEEFCLLAGWITLSPGRGIPPQRLVRARLRRPRPL